MELFLWILFGIVAIGAGTCRLAFSFPDKANKPMFWIVAPVAIITVCTLIYIAIRVFNL